MSTTAAIPGVDLPVAQSAMFWSSGHPTMAAAGEWLQTCARDNGYDAVVGVCFTPHPLTGYGYRFLAGATELRWAVSGTAIRWQH